MGDLPNRKRLTTQLTTGRCDGFEGVKANRAAVRVFTIRQFPAKVANGGVECIQESAAYGFDNHT